MHHVVVHHGVGTQHSDDLLPGSTIPVGRTGSADIVVYTEVWVNSVLKPFRLFGMRHDAFLTSL